MTASDALKVYEDIYRKAELLYLLNLKRNVRDYAKIILENRQSLHRLDIVFPTDKQKNITIQLHRPIKKKKGSFCHAKAMVITRVCF